MDLITMSAWILSLFAVFLAVAFWLFIRSYPYKIRIREQTSTNTRLIHDKLARVAKDEDKVEYLKMFGKVGSILRIPLPPPEAIDYDPKKKKKIVEAWYSDETGITYVTDAGEYQGFQPFTTKQRQMLVNQIYKKEARKVKNWTEHIPAIAGLATLAIIVTVVLLFWGEAIAPIQSAAATSITAMDKADKLYARIDAVLENKQLVFEDDGGGG